MFYWKPGILREFFPLWPHFQTHPYCVLWPLPLYRSRIARVDHCIATVGLRVTHWRWSENSSEPAELGLSKKWGCWIPQQKWWFYVVFKVFIGKVMFKTIGCSHNGEIHPNKWQGSWGVQKCVLTCLDQNGAMIARKHTNTCWSLAIKNWRAYQHVGAWPNMLENASVFFKQQNPSTMGTQEAAFWRAEPFKALSHDAHQCIAVQIKTTWQSHSGNANCPPFVKLLRPPGKLTPSKVGLK